MNRYIAVVKADSQNFTFMFKVFKSVRPRERKIELSFYKDYNPDLVKIMTHYEVRILSLPFVIEGDMYKYHIHKSSIDSMNYICWSGCVADIAIAKRLIEVWSLGTVRHCLKGFDFVDILNKEGFDSEGLISLLESEILGSCSVEEVKQ